MFYLAVFFSTVVTAISPAPSRLNYRDDVAIPGYTYEGCYTEATNMRALSDLAYYNDLMTVEDCAAACSSYTWFGVEYGRECYCGNTLNPGSVPAPALDCDFECPGNADETCGAGNRLNMYSSSPTAPVVPLVITTYSTMGCYTEATNKRALSLLSTTNDDMTVEICGTFCIGFDYFGVEYSRECYCGNTINPGSVPALSSDCDMQCLGDTSELCGGPVRLNMY
ncbi:WSC domain containing protein, partial [Hyaloscypha variabilis]